VLDLTNARSGPIAVRQLADWGADVIRVERLVSNQVNEGLISRRNGSDFQNLHRNKRSIGLDLKSEEGLKIFKQLVEDADVVIENMRPAVKYRLGIDYETLRKINPRLVYGSISGFGQDGPYGERGGVDQVLQGMSGLMSVTGSPGQGPLRVGIAISDITTGMFLAIGILTALLDREVTGKGTWVRTSLLECMINILDNQAMRYVSNGEVAKPTGNDHPFWVPMGTYATSDNKLVNIYASSQRMFPRFCKVADLTELIDDPRCASPESRVANAAEIRKIVAERIRERPADRWVEELNAVGVPTGPVLNIEEVFKDPQVRHLGVTRSVEHPELGRLDLLASPLDIQGASKDIRLPTPGIGEHSREILAEIGYTDAQIDRILEAGVVELA
jgi:formyl-CoA transferase